VRAHAEVIAEPGPYGTRLGTLRSQAPLLLRPTPDALYLVSGAAGPLGGDELELTLTVRTGAALTVRTTAATLALPGRTGAPSLLRIRATVEDGARLDFLPEPTIVAARARHHADTFVTLTGDARLTWHDALILGRHDEPGGTYRGRLYADLDGRPLLRHALDLDPADDETTGPAVLQGHRSVTTVLTVGAEPVPDEPPTPTSATMRLAGSATAALRTVLGSGPDARRPVRDSGHAYRTAVIRA